MKAGTSSTNNIELGMFMFIEVFEVVLADKRFQLSSPQATRARLFHCHVE